MQLSDALFRVRQSDVGAGARGGSGQQRCVLLQGRGEGSERVVEGLAQCT